MDYKVTLYNEEKEEVITLRGTSEEILSVVDHLVAIMEIIHGSTTLRPSV